ncbi:MAG: hypothetical protein J6K17_07475 [Oscillospiraceae bacterium]|nr:hypothetical protein [Oscillospiraceae bacterium]
MCNCSNRCEDGKCRLAVAVEDNYAPCVFPKKYFDVEIRSKDGCFETFGKVAAGGSQVFDLPCGNDGDGSTEYSVTVIGDMLSSPRSQTRRVCCCCGNTSGVTFIFMTYEPDCENRYPHPCPPPCPPICPPPCPPPCPPHPPMPCIEFVPQPPECPCGEDY